VQRPIRSLLRRPDSGRVRLIIIIALCLALGLGDIAEGSTVGRIVLPALRAAPWLAVALVLLSVRRPVPPWWVTLSATAWLGVLTLSAVLAPNDQMDALRALLRPVSGVLLAFAVYAATRRRRQWLVACAALSGGGLLVAVTGLLQWADASPITAALASLHDSQPLVADVPRLTSALSHPNVAAIVLELTLPPLVALALYAPARWRMSLLVLVLLQLGALTLTFSRAGITAEATGLAAMALVALWRGARNTFVAVTSLAVAAPLSLVLGAGALPQVERRLLAEVEQASYRATYTAPPVVAAAPAQVLEVPVRVTNAGDSEWTALDSSRVALGYHLLRPDGTPIEFDSPATLLPADVPPNASLDIVAHLRAPAAVGLYVVEWDALREGVAWFSWRGSPPALMDLLVEPAAPTVVASSNAAEVAMPRPARVQYWMAALAMLRDSPLLGQGPDNFRLRFTDYAGIDESHIGTHAHSLYLETLADTGFLGFATLLGLLVAVFRSGTRALVGGEDWLLRAALLASLATWLLHGLLDDFERFLPAHLAYWIVVGLLLRGGRLAQRSDGGH
jgi:hypothetical protein